MAAAPREVTMGSLNTLVPRPLDSFVGRAEELQAVKTLLATHRFVTLTGPAGIGKTRLALRIAEELAPGPGPANAHSVPAGTVRRPHPAYVDGVCFVPLVELTDAALVPQAVALALGVHEQPDRSLVEALTDFLASWAVLLVWDNCDYVTEGC